MVVFSKGDSLDGFKVKVTTFEKLSGLCWWFAVGLDFVEPFM